MAEPSGPKEDQYIDVPLGGLQTGITEEKVPPGAALEAQDCVFRKEGEVARMPSWGNTSAGSLSGTPNAIGPIGDNVAVFCADGSASVYNTESSTLVELDTVLGSPTPVTIRSICHGGRPSMFWSSAVVDNVMCVVFLCGDTDYGQSSGAPTQTDDAAVMFMLLDATTGDIIQKPTLWADASSLNTDLAVPTVRAINGFFVIATRYDFDVFAGPGLFSWFFNRGSAELHVGVIDTTGAVTTAMALLHANMMQYDFYAEDGQSVGYIYATTWTTAVVAAQGASTLYRLSVNASGVLSTTSLSVTTAAGPQYADATPIVYHNVSTGKVLLGFFDCHVANPVVRTVTCNSDLTGLGAFTAIYSIGLGPGDTENDVASWNEFTKGSLLYFTLLRSSGAFIKINSGGTTVAFLWQGFASFDLTAANIANANYGFPAAMAGFHPCGIRHTFVDGTTGASVIDAGVSLAGLLPIEAQLMMTSKPWFDGENAYVACGVAPPFNLSQENGSQGIGKYHASNRSNFNSFAYQAAGFIAHIPSGYTTHGTVTTELIPGFLAPKAVFNVDLQQHPMFGSMWVMPQVYQVGNYWKVATQVERDFEIAPSYSGYDIMYGTTGALVSVSTATPVVQPIPIDGGLVLPEGAHRLFDGSSVLSAPMPSVQAYALLSDSGGTHTPPYTLGSTYLCRSFTGKTIRSGVCEGTTDGAANWWQYAYEQAAVVGELGDIYAFYPPFANSLFSTTRVGAGEPQGKIYWNDGLLVSHSLSTFANYFYRLVEFPTASVTDAPQHYMDAGELGAELPAGAICATSRRDRLFYVDCDDVFTIRSSKIIGPTTWVEYNQNLYARIPDTTGGITALAAMDDKVVAFTETSIYYLVGEGPNNLGRGGWDAPRKIASSLGCVDRRSVISFEGGVTFLSKRGLELLDRNLVVQSLGDPASRYFDEILAETRTLCGVVNVGKHSELRWVTKSSDGYTDIIVYNYGTDKWSVWVNVFDSTGVNPTEPVSTCVAGDIHYILTKRTFGGSTFYALQRDSDTTYGGTLEYETSWLKPQGQHEYFRAKVLYLSGYFSNMVAPDSVVITAYYDYDKSSAPSDTYTISTANLTRNASGYFEIRLPLAVQKCESVKFHIAMDPSGGSTELTKLINLGLEFALMEGANKVPFTIATVT